MADVHDPAPTPVEANPPEADPAPTLKRETLMTVTRKHFGLLVAAVGLAGLSLGAMTLALLRPTTVVVCVTQAGGPPMAPRALAAPTIRFHHPPLRARGMTFLGVHIRTDDPGRFAQPPGAESTDGAEVVGIFPHTPAEHADIRRGDVITKVGDDDIANAEQLVACIRGHQPGDQVEVSLRRDGKPMTVEATLSEWNRSPR
jgi:PDZ domain